MRLGMPYEQFIVLLAVTLISQAIELYTRRRLDGSIYGTVLKAESPFPNAWAAIEVLAMFCWLPVLAIGFLALRWYIMIGFFLGASIVGGLLNTAFMRCDMDMLLRANRASHFVIISLTIYLWVQVWLG